MKNKTAIIDRAFNKLQALNKKIKGKSKKIQSILNPVLKSAAHTLRIIKAKGNSQLQLLGLGILGNLNAKFSPVTEIPRSQIELAPKLFQNREGAFSQETVDKILREGFDKSQEPIAVWHDPVSGKYKVISGHSRWHASELLYKQGNKALATMPVKIFNGDLEAARDYALLESNRSGTQEGLVSDLKAYKRAIEKGKTKAELLSLFKTESKLNTLKNLACLNPKGKFLQYMGTDSEKSVPFLERNAVWVGILRRTYPQLSDSHENEMYDYMYSGKSKLEVQKETFFSIVEKKVLSAFFNPNQPLNLANRASTSAYTDQSKEVLSLVNAEIERLQTDRAKKENNIARARVEITDIERQKKLISQFMDEISLINQAILRKLDERTKLEQATKAIERATEFDLFTQPASRENIKVQKVEPTAKPEPKKPEPALVREAANPVQATAKEAPATKSKPAAKPAKPKAKTSKPATDANLTRLLAMCDGVNKQLSMLRA